jgi:hypothetical protein
MATAEIKLRSIIHEIVMNELDGSQLSADMGRRELTEINNPFIVAPIVTKEAGTQALTKTIKQAHVNVANSFRDRVSNNSKISDIQGDIEKQINKSTVDAVGIPQNDIEKITITEFDQLIQLGILTDAQKAELLDSFAIEARESLLDGCISAVGGEKPTTRDYINRVLASGTEMFTFGVVDNAVLIFAGDYIDGKLDGRLLRNVKGPGKKYYQIVMVGFVAAGVGNAVSDGFGAAIAGPALEATGFTPENYVTDEQMKGAPRFWRALDSAAGTIGVVVGCIVGLVPAFFLDSYKTALAAAGYVWGARALAASTQIELPFAVAAAEAAAGVTAAGAVVFTGVVIAVGTLGYGLYSWGSLKSAQSKNNKKDMANHERRVLMDLGIKVGVNIDKSQKQWRAQITNKDIALFKNAIINRKDEVQELWNKHMHPTQIASDTDSYDVPDLYDKVEASSASYGLGFPTNIRDLDESRWQKLAGII